jgi:3-oxoacyl-[acyl-carrier-protein] synthase II
MRAALRDAGIDARDVRHVNAHATSTPVGDIAEIHALREVLGPHPVVTATKSMHGHLLGAAGAVEAIATIATLRERVVAPTLGLEQPDEGMDLDYVPGESRPLDTNGHNPIGISNSFGFGGHNAVLVLEAA